MHSPHIFKSTPLSQFRRAVLICSDPTDRVDAINYMMDKMINSGYQLHELLPAKIRALSLDRDTLLETPETDHKKVEPNTLTFVVNQNPLVKKELKSLITTKKDDLNRLIGDHRIIIAEKKHPSTAGILFAKSSFSSTPKIINSNQKCNAKRCKTCKIMELPRKVKIEEKLFHLDYSLNCKTQNVIYLLVCRHCDAFSKHYWGRTMEELHTRMNGHRGNFKMKNSEYKKSALAMHIYEEHVIYFGDKLNNFKLGIVKSTSPMRLERCEDYYIWETRADLISLNRNKPAI